MKKNETIADIVRDLRGFRDEMPGEAITWPRQVIDEELDDLADRIEEAHKREKAVTDALLDCDAYYPPILDATCGSRMIHFDKDCPDVMFCDNRECDGEAIWKSNSRNGVSVRHLEIHPDVIADFTCLPFPDETFYLVVLDPPHLKHIGENAWMAKKYGVLKGNWKQMLRDGFNECMRVLKPGGSLIFKWSEVQIPVGEIWKAVGTRPIFGTRCGKSAKTIWATFWKETRDDRA